MFDLPMIILLKSIIETAEPLYGIPKVAGLPGIPVIQAYQPTQQGVATGPAAYLDIIGHQRVGQPAREDFYDEDTEKEVHRETQVMITRFQLSALATQDPKSTTQYTAADIINLLGMILRSSDTIAKIEAEGLGMLLDQPSRNPKFIDDRGRFEAQPSLDFGITHKLIVSTEVPVLQSTEFDIYVI